VVGGWWSATYSAPVRIDQHGEIPALVHSAGHLLAAGVAGAAAVSARLGPAAAIPPRRYRGRRGARIVVGDFHAARTSGAWGLTPFT